LILLFERRLLSNPEAFAEDIENRHLRGPKPGKLRHEAGRIAHVCAASRTTDGAKIRRPE
jgi:hypothetical protein